jgi:hypothetical protein
LITDHLGSDGRSFDFKIVFSGSLGKDDDTYSTFKNALKTPVAQILPSYLMQF